MSTLLVCGVVECGCRNDKFHRRKCPLRRYMGSDSGFRNEPLSVKIGRYKLKGDQFVVNRWPWPKLQGFDSCRLNVFPPLKKDKLSGRSFVDVSLSPDAVSQVSRITNLLSSELGAPFVETKRMCLFHEALSLTSRLNKKFDSFPLQLSRIELHKSRGGGGGVTDLMVTSGQAELTIPCRTDDSSEARMERQVRCREKTAQTSKVFKAWCCTFIVLIAVLILIPIIATEILNRQAAHAQATAAED